MEGLNRRTRVLDLVLGLRLRVICILGKLHSEAKRRQ